MRTRSQRSDMRSRDLPPMLSRKACRWPNLKNQPPRRFNRLPRASAAILWVVVFTLPARTTASSPEGLQDRQSEVLHNGIVLESPWPPRRTTHNSPASPPPYLVSPPAVIPIDVGRQLFVDDFLIETSSLVRTFHQAQYFAGNPVLQPDKPWEQVGSEDNPGGSAAMPYSDGAWYDPSDRLFKLWYMGGYVGGVCYAFSKDGIHWQKPLLGVEPGTNIVLPAKQRGGSTTVWLDHEERNPQRRFKLAVHSFPDDTKQLLFFSRDGIHWGEPVIGAGRSGDRSTMFYNPFRKVWVYSIKHRLAGARSRLYRESADLAAGASWKQEEPVLWVGADSLDPERNDLKTKPQLYNLDAVAYESILLGLFTIWRGQPTGRPKPNELVVGYSRDGFHWDRPVRTAFIPVSERRGDWNWGNVQSSGGGCLVVGDKLYFYVSGRAGQPGNSRSGVCSTGLAVLRRDGFASLGAGAEGGMLTTRPVVFKGKYLFVNTNVQAGELRVEVVDERGEAIGPYTRRDCEPVRSDQTLQAVRWKGARDLSRLVGKAVRFRFHVANGSLYSFWVSPDRSGSSQGYVAAGGPGFTGSRDTVGAAAYRSVGRQTLITP